MSRDLEREYRALVNSEVPDLWARIEAGLEDKKTAPRTDRTDMHITDFPITDSQMEHTRVRKANFKVWAGLAAACACVVLIVPVMVRHAAMGGSKGFSSSAPSSDTAPQAYWKAEDNGQEEAAYENFDGAAAEHGNDKSAVTQDNTQAVADSNMNGAGTASGAQEMDEAAAAEEPGAYRFHATVEILGTNISADGGVLYTAKVLSADQSVIEVDSEIQIVCSKVLSESMTVLEVHQTYDLVLREDHSGETGQEVVYLLVDE